ncbi:unnamed protein product [Cercospora beticola]|nr:unnamed protein product [Cercospora beticola]
MDDTLRMRVRGCSLQARPRSLSQQRRRARVRQRVDALTWMWSRKPASARDGVSAWCQRVGRGWRLDGHACCLLAPPRQKLAAATTAASANGTSGALRRRRVVSAAVLAREHMEVIVRIPSVNGSRSL